MSNSESVAKSLDREKNEREGSISLVVLLAAALIIIAIALALMGREEARPMILGVLCTLAVGGVFSMFALAVGVLRFSEGTPRDEIATAVVENVPEGVLVTAANGRTLYANPAYMRLIGVDRFSDVRGVERAFAGNADAAEAIFRLSQAAGEGRRAEEEIRLERGVDGERGVTWYRIRVHPIGRDRAPRMMWEISDITRERARQEDVFLELQRAIDNLDHAPAGFFSTDRDGRLRYVNATLANWLGYDLAETETARLRLDDIVSGDGAALIRQVAPAPGEVRSETIDLDLVRRNGQTLPVRLMHKVAFDNEGRAGASRTLVLDRSPGADVSETLRAAEVRFARFFNNTPLAIATVDRSGQVRRTNAAFARLFPQSTPRRIEDCTAAGDRALLGKLLEKAFGGRADLAPADAHLPGEGGKVGRFFASPVEDSDGDGEAAIVYILDVTEQRELEAQFAQGQKMQAVGLLAGGVAHDFNNLLTAIIGYSDLLLINNRPTDPSFNDIMQIKHNANRAAGLVRQLLAFSRRQTLRPEVLRLGDVLNDLQVLLSRLLGSSVELTVQVDRELWLVKADLNQLEQVAINLAVNARDAMPEGGSLFLRAENLALGEPRGAGSAQIPAGEFVVVEVQDTGTGMSDETMEKIFDPFFTTKEIGKGTGLGLSTVYGIVKQTGGHIEAESTLGEGTTFRIYLPRYVPAPEEVPPKAGQAPAKAKDLTGSGTILLVEDEESVRIYAARALSSRGYTVLEADTGEMALELMDEHGGEIDLVVSDVVMPEMDGPTLMKELRARNPGLKIIFVSGYAEDAFKRSLDGGAEDFHFLSKPFDLRELAAKVKDVLSGQA
ncbi:cell cycle histidine kinase CckA [Lutibaculum baratangense]|nr:PAS domain-containing sensor histidine kinase [Lutibaculum baratangense]